MGRWYALRDRPTHAGSFALHGMPGLLPEDGAKELSATGTWVTGPVPAPPPPERKYTRREPRELPDIPIEDFAQLLTTGMDVIDHEYDTWQEVLADMRLHAAHVSEGSRVRLPPPTAELAGVGEGDSDAMEVADLVDANSSMSPADREEMLRYFTGFRDGTLPEEKPFPPEDPNGRWMHHIKLGRKYALVAEDDSDSGWETYTEDDASDAER